MSNLTPSFNFTWLEPDWLAAGSIPYRQEHLDSLGDVAAILSLTCRNPITCFNLTLKPTQAHLHLPIIDGDVPTAVQLAQALNFIEQYPCIYVHCRQGIGRTGIILIAYYVLRQGLSLNEALARVQVRHHATYPHILCGPQGEVQEAWIRALK